MRQVLSILVALLFVAGCGGGDGSDGYVEPETEATGWQGEGIFLPRESYAQICVDPTKAYDQAKAVQGTYVDENNWLRSFFNETYLWYDEVIDRNPSCCSTPDYFDTLKVETRDRFSYIQSLKEFLDSQSGVNLAYGFRMIFYRDREGAFILYVSPNSPAEEAGLSRGMHILEIDGVPTKQALSRLDSSKPETHVFTVVRLGETQSFSVTMTSREVSDPGVQWTSSRELINGRRVGYLLFNSHIEPAEPYLISAVEYFNSQGVNDLVLDLRYNGGGIVAIANELAYMIAGPRRTENRIFEKFIYNDKIPSEQELFLSTDSRGFPLPSLNLDRVFILTSSSTASASESIINGLRGIDVEVILIGETTVGKTQGWRPEENCGTIYSIVQFRGVNDKGWGSFEDGFQPICQAFDDIRYPLGNSAENMLATAIHYINFDQCPTSQQADRTRGSAAVNVPSGQLDSSDVIEIWPPIIPSKILD